MNYPKEVKEIKNLNEFIRKAREFETDKYWSNILYDCSSANYADWTRRESRLKWKREMIQKYLDYKNNKLNESYNFDDYNTRIQQYCDNELSEFTKLINEKFPKIKVSRITSKRGEDRLKLTHKNLIITIMLMELLTTESGKPEYAISYDGKQQYIGPKEDVLNFIDKYIKDDYKLEEKASIDWNNYLTKDEVKKFLSKDDKVESAENIIYSKEFEPRYKDLHNPLQAKYKNSWTRKELVQDLNEFYNFGHLITESENKLMKRIPENQKYKVKDCYKDGTGKYTIDLNNGFETSYGTNYIQCKTIKDCIYELENFVNEKFEESNNENLMLDKVNKYIEDNTNSLIDLKELSTKVKVYISTVGRKLNNAKYDYERNNYKRQQEFYRDVLKEINKRLNKTESKHKIEEKSRNELLAKTKSQTITRYNKAQEYKGFYIRGVDTDELLKKDSLLTINCQVGNYRDQVQMENMLYWVEYEIEERNHDLQVTSKYITQALMDAIDGMNIKVNCECRGLGL